MQPETIDYNEVLRDLTERRNELDAAVRAIRRIVAYSMNVPGGATASPVSNGRATDAPGGLSSVAAAAANIRAALDRTEP